MIKGDMYLKISKENTIFGLKCSKIEGCPPSFKNACPVNYSYLPTCLKLWTTIRTGSACSSDATHPLVFCIKRQTKSILSIHV